MIRECDVLRLYPMLPDLEVGEFNLLMK